MTTVRTIADLTAQQQIDLLAQEHHLIHNHSQLDEICATFGRVSVSIGGKLTRQII
jgi:hypothetical protein